MKTKSHYGELAINLLSGLIEPRILPQTHTTSHGEHRANAGCNHRTLTFALHTTNTNGDERVQKPVSCASATHPNTDPNQNGKHSAKSCTDLAADHHFAILSKDLFRRQQATKSECFPAGILASPEQENSAEYSKSVHHQFSKTQSRQGIPFFCRTGLVGECTSRHFWLFMRLLMQQMLNNTITQFDLSVQG